MPHATPQLDDETPLVAAFETHRARLRAIALRMLGSGTDADDALQEAWIRTARADPAADVDNPLAWLTTVLSRVCLTMLAGQSHGRIAALALDTSPPVGAPATAQPATAQPAAGSPDDAVLAADEVGPALRLVMAALTPEERIAFVLHDAFSLPFADIAQVLGKSPTATRQLASRARRRVRDASRADVSQPDWRERTVAPDEQSVVNAFLAVSRGGDFAALVRLLHPAALLRADATAVGWGAEAEISGAAAVAATFAGRAQAARPALVDGRAAAIWMQGGALRLVFAFTVDDGLVTGLALIADPEALAAMVITPLRAGAPRH